MNASGDNNLKGLRHQLHRQPELSGHEAATAKRLSDWMRQHQADEVRTELGGHGLAGIWQGEKPGPTVLFRAELDALPLQESSELPHASTRPGVAHKCGHDGHMAILAGVAQRLSLQPPAFGRVVLLLQPAEETGQGAAQVLADAGLADLQPDWVFALHNLPGFELGQLVIGAGSFAAASCGVEIELLGRSSHAAEPHLGNNPGLAVAELIQAVSALTQKDRRATIIHARLGQVAFGTSPGDAVVMATLRAFEQPVMERMQQTVVDLVERIGPAHGLQTSLQWREPFPATVNQPQAVRLVERAARVVGLSIQAPAAPFGWSEDFGHFTARFPGALIGLGAGEQQPPLHHPDYDFPDALIPIGVDLLWALIHQTGGR